MRFSTLSPSIELSDLDLAVACLGYESRGTSVSRRYFGHARRKIALGFDKNLKIAFKSNLKYFKDTGFEVYESVADLNFEALSQEIIRSALTQDKSIRVAIDISCFDRFRLATLVLGLHELLVDGLVSEVVYFYNIGRYHKPRADFAVNTRLQPVHPSFVGLRADPLAPIAAIIGLGYEREKAIGAAEYLEASDVFAFHPRSSVVEYFESVVDANSLLLNQIDSRRRFIYEVEDPASQIADLSSLVRGLMTRSSVILIPLGPKMFALSCLITARLFPRVSVWRMSQSDESQVLDRLPTDYYSILRIAA